MPAANKAMPMWWLRLMRPGLKSVLAPTTTASMAAKAKAASSSVMAAAYCDSTSAGMVLPSVTRSMRDSATEALEATASAAPWANRPRMSFQSTRLGRMRASESQLRHKSALMTSISMIQPQTTQVTGPLTHMTIITMPSRENMARMRAICGKRKFSWA